MMPIEKLSEERRAGKHHRAPGQSLVRSTATVCSWKLIVIGVGALGGLKGMVGCPPIPLSWPSRCRTSTTERVNDFDPAFGLISFGTYSPQLAAFF